MVNPLLEGLTFEKKLCDFEWSYELIKRETVVLLFSIAMGIVIITVLTFFTIWICFPVENPKESFKDALGFSGGLFGGLTTFGAAIIAAHLFNDWGEEADFHARKEFAIPVIELLALIKYELRQFQEIMFNLKFVDNYAFLNTKYAEYLCFDPKKEIFKLTPNIKYLNKYESKDECINIVLEYTSLERHISQVRFDFIDLIDIYTAYYNKVIELGGFKKIKFIANHIVPMNIMGFQNH